MTIKKAFIDVETTGLDSSKNDIWQLAGILEIDGKEVERFNFKMNPPAASVLDKEALEIAKITEEEIRAFPDHSICYKKFTDILNKHCSKFDKFDKFYMIGYNVYFDNQFLRKWFLQNEDKYFGSYFWSPSIDVMTLAIENMMAFRENLANFKLTTVTSVLHEMGIIDVSDVEGNYHDAMKDIEVTKRIYDAFKVK